MSNQHTTIKEMTPGGATYRSYIITAEGMNPYILLSDCNGMKGVDLFTGQTLFAYKAPPKNGDVITGLYRTIGNCKTVEDVRALLFGMIRQMEAEAR